jgi:hypothetical protein
MKGPMANKYQLKTSASIKDIAILAKIAMILNKSLFCTVNVKLFLK